MTATVKHIALGVGAGILALGVTAGVYVHAQDQNTNEPRRPFMGRGMGPGGPGGPMGMLPMLGRQIGLTDTQRDQVKAIADSHKDEWRSLAQRARAAHDALNQAVTAETLDEALIRQRSSEAAAVDADMAVARAHAHAEVFQILTTEQKAQLKTLQTDRRSRK